MNEYIKDIAEKVAEIMEGLTDAEIYAVVRTFLDNHTSAPKVNNNA